MGVDVQGHLGGVHTSTSLADERDDRGVSEPHRVVQDVVPGANLLTTDRRVRSGGEERLDDISSPGGHRLM
jgi:hypothetical protein